MTHRRQARTSISGSGSGSGSCSRPDAATAAPAPTAIPAPAAAVIPTAPKLRGRAGGAVALPKAGALDVKTGFEIGVGAS